MSNNSCKNYQVCGAPICPMDERSLKCIWYPDEEICISSAYGNLTWIKAQRKIAKTSAQANRYFTVEMLEANCVIRKGIIGLDPNVDEKPQLQRWLKEHPSKRILSEEETISKIQRIKKYQFCAQAEVPSLKGQNPIP